MLSLRGDIDEKRSTVFAKIAKNRFSVRLSPSRRPKWPILRSQTILAFWIERRCPFSLGFVVLEISGPATKIGDFHGGIPNRSGGQKNNAPGVFGGVESDSDTLRAQKLHPNPV